MYRRPRAQNLICMVALILALAIPALAQDEECSVGAVGWEVLSTSTPGGGGTMESQGLTGERTAWMISHAAPSTAGSAVANVSITYYHCKACRDKALRKKKEEEAKKKAGSDKKEDGDKKKSEDKKKGGIPPAGPDVISFDPRTHELKDGKVVPKNPKAEDPHQHCPRPERFECGQHYYWWLKSHTHRSEPGPADQDYRYDGLDRKVKKVGSLPVTGEMRIVMTGTVVAGKEASASVVDQDGSLISGVVVELPDGSQATTDEKGQVAFCVPYGKEAATLLLPGVLVKNSAWVWNSTPSSPQLPKPLRPSPLISKPLVAGTRTALLPGANERVTEVLVDGMDAHVLASSPSETLIDVPASLEPGPQAMALKSGNQVIDVRMADVVRVVVDPPKTLILGQRADWTIRIVGSDAPLTLMVKNETPHVVKLVDRSSSGTFKTCGGRDNSVKVKVQATGQGTIRLPVAVIGG